MEEEKSYSGMNHTEAKFCLIVTGGSVDQGLLAAVYEGAYGYPVHPYVIGVDKGLEALEQLDIEPDLIIGDFDSANDGIRAKYVTSPDAVVRDRCIVLNPEKDFTDTHVAVLEAVKCGFTRVLLLGATGTRLDHTLGNLGLLYTCCQEGICAEILDPHNRISLIKEEKIVRAEKLYGPYISLLPFSECVKGITLKGFKYNAHDLSIKKGETIGISNELREEEGHITIGDGYLFLMETKD